MPGTVGTNGAIRSGVAPDCRARFRCDHAAPATPRRVASTKQQWAGYGARRIPADARPAWPEAVRAARWGARSPPGRSAKVPPPASPAQPGRPCWLRGRRGLGPDHHQPLRRGGAGRLDRHRTRPPPGGADKVVVGGRHVITVAVACGPARRGAPPGKPQLAMSVELIALDPVQRDQGAVRDG